MHTLYFIEDNLSMDSDYLQTIKLMPLSFKKEIYHVGDTEKNRQNV